MALAQMDYDDEAWSDEQFNANARKVIKTLMAWREMDAVALAEAAGIKKSTLYTRLDDEHPARLLGPEIKRIARALGVKPQVFFEPVDSLMDASRLMRWSTDSPALTCVNDVLGQMELAFVPERALALAST